MSAIPRSALLADVASDLGCAVDRVAFAARCGLQCDPWQARLLRSRAWRILLNVTRSGGKSSVVAVLGLHAAIYEPPALVLLLSRAQRQSEELMRRLLTYYRALGRPVDPEAEGKLELELDNGSRVVALPGTEETIRSYSGAAWLIIDEASRVKDETYLAVRPMLLTSAGKLVALSTPFGKRGWWSAAWHSEGEVGAEEWERYFMPADQHPRFTPEQLEMERRAMGDWWYEQELLCQFKDPQTAAFRSEDVDAAIQAYDVWDFGRFLPGGAAPKPPEPDPPPAEEQGVATWHFDPYLPPAPSTPAPTTAWGLTPAQLAFQREADRMFYRGWRP